MFRLALLLLLKSILYTEGLVFEEYKESVSFTSSDEDSGSPLFLTPYIENGNIDEARQLARVTLPDHPDVESYAGFFTVDKTYNSNIFVWYFPPTKWKANIRKEKRLTTAFGTIVWLQGGPGFTSLFGLFEETGQITVRKNRFMKREHHWNDINHMIFIDSPVGSGFSFTNDSRGYSTNETHIGDQLYSVVHQFYQLFPELLNVDLVVSGEAYGCKHAAALGKTIHENNFNAQAQGKLVLPLTGLTIGSGWCDPINQLNQVPFVFQLGLLDHDKRRIMEPLADSLRELIKNEAWSQTRTAFLHYISVLTSLMGDIFLYDFVRLKRSEGFIDCQFCTLINMPTTRKAIHVGNLTFYSYNADVANYLNEDFMKSVAPWISELLENYKVLMYNGQQDIIVPYISTTNFIRHLNWSAREEYENAARQKPIFGYNRKPLAMSFVRTAGNLMEVLIMNAGHNVAVYQPLLLMIYQRLWYEYYTNRSNNTFIWSNERKIELSNYIS